MMLDEKFGKEKQNLSSPSNVLDSSLWNGPSIDFSIGSYITTYPLQVNGVHRLLDMQEKEVLSSLTSSVQYEMLESIEKPISRYFHNYDDQHVTLHVDEMQLSADTMALIDEK